MRTDRGGVELKVVIPATLETADRFLDEFRRWRGLQSVSAPWFDVELLLREALANAVKHGSHGDPAKQVCCVLRLRGRRLTIAVRDEGAGFDWRAAVRIEAENSKPSGLGIPIYREYATRVRFNNRGNAVTLVKQF